LDILPALSYIRGRRWIRRAGVAALLAGGLAMTGCGTSTPAAPLPDGGNGPTSTSPTATATGETDPVLAGYLAYWDAVIHANATASPNDPLLVQHATGAALTDIRAGIARNRTQELSVRGTVTHQARVLARDGDSATVDDCYDTRNWKPVDVKSGKDIGAVPDNGTGRYRERYTMRQISGIWLVVTSKSTGSC
jgi:hypothetical protein